MLKRIGRVILSAAMAAALVLLAINFYFWYEVPRTPYGPDYRHGLIYPYNSNGETHYVTWFDHLLSDIFAASIFVVVLILIAAFMAANFKKNDTR